MIANPTRCVEDYPSSDPQRTSPPNPRDPAPDGCLPPPGAVGWRPMTRIEMGPPVISGRPHRVIPSARRERLTPRRLSIPRLLSGRVQVQCQS